MRTVIAYLPWLVLVSSCSSPPKPPTVDDSMKRPANSQTAVELQVCRNDLQNTRILAAESGRLAESTAATLASVTLRQQLLAVLQSPPAAATQGNSVHTVRFEFGSTRVAIPADVAATLVEEARSAPLVLLRGRTDGASDSPAESRIARERAAAVRDALVAAGVDPARIRSTFQPSGDPVADNATAAGRGLNRRVEIEIYRAMPVPAHAAEVAARRAPDGLGPQL
jgi:outer membrane protein OmpA-like peptidoglycan-associated protein